MAAQKSKGLGKGLGALFTDIEIDSETTSKSRKIKSVSSDTDIEGEEILFVDINNIKPNTSQPRKNFDEDSIEELAQSIKAHGVIQPIMLRKSASGYELVAGERRWRAARNAGLKTVPAIIRELNEEQNAFFALIENMQREDLNPIEEATALQQIISRYSVTQEELSNSVGKSRPYITNILRLLKMPQKIQDYIADDMLTIGHAKAIAAIKPENSQLALADKIVKKGLSVRETEQLANKQQNTDISKKRNTFKGKNKEVADVEEELTSIMGTKVIIKTNGQKGKIELNYYSRDELEGLIDSLRKLGKVK